MERQRDREYFIKSKDQANLLSDTNLESQRLSKVPPHVRRIAERGHIAVLVQESDSLKASNGAHSSRMNSLSLNISSLML